jgi:PmbA protein
MGQKYHRRPPFKNEGAARLILDQIKTVLSGSKADGWQINWAEKTSHQSFLALNTLECRREVRIEAATITVYKKHADGALGSSTFKISPNAVASLPAKLEQALFAAGLVSNQAFELPEPGATYPTVELADPSVRLDLLSSLEQRLLAAVSKEKHIRLSAAELFLDRAHSRLINHKGVDVQQESTALHTEFILLCRTDSRENEFIDRYTRRFATDFNLEGEVASSAQAARDATIAVAPKTGTYAVIFSEEPLDNLFNPIIARSSARLKYNNMIQTSLGSAVTDTGQTRGDKLTIWSNPTLKGGGASYRFDGYGTPARPVCLIKKNQVENLTADQRYAQYLNVPVTGEMGNIEVEGGSHSFESLLHPVGASPIYHIKAFSAFEPNSITGAFSAEIRAGYEISPTGARPIKGGSVSGVLQRDMLDCRLSSERVQRESALVPKAIRFEALTLAGQ